MSPPSPAPDHLPLTVVCEFAHAAAQDVANDLRVDLLHLKGAALDSALSWPDRTFSDADVLVRPDGVERLLAALHELEWRTETSFEAGSPFGHAATLQHPVWGYLDVHRLWPGFGVSPEQAFDALWAQHRYIDLAGFRCSVPQLVDQALIQCLNVARSGETEPSDHVAVRACRTAHGGQVHARLGERVRELKAEVAYSVLLGTLDDHAGHPDQPLWAAISRKEGRVAEWKARVRREPTKRGSLRVLARAFTVNVEHLRARHRRPVSHAEVAVEFLSRLKRAARELLR